MASTLKNVVSYVAVGPGIQVSLPHGVHREGTGLVPDIVNFSNPAFSLVACDATDLVIQNNSVVAEDCDALCESWHSQDRNFVTPMQAALAPQPFVPQADSGSVGGIYPSVLVFRPGGVQVGNIYTDWSNLMTAKGLIDGPGEVELDDTLAAITIPAGNWDLTDWVLRGPEGSGPLNGPYVILADDCLFTGLRRITRGLRIENRNTTTSPIILANGERLELIDGVDLCSGFGIVIPAVVSTGGAGTNIYIRLDSGSSLGVMNSGVVAATAANHGLTLEMGDNTLVMDDVLVGPSPATLILALYSPSAKVKPQVAWIDAPAWLNTQDQAFRLNPQPDVVPSIADVASLSFGEFIRLNATAGLFVQNLPQIVGPAINNFHSAGRWIAIKETSGLNGITVTPFAGDTIDGAATFALSPGGEALLISDGVTDWKVISIGLNQLLNRVNTFARAQGTAKVTLVDAADIATNATLGNVFEVTLAGNRNLSAPTGLISGFTYMWIIKQSAGANTIACNAIFKFPGGVAPVLSAAAAAVDVLTAVYDGTILACVFQADFR